MPYDTDWQSYGYHINDRGTKSSFVSFTVDIFRVFRTLHSLWSTLILDRCHRHYVVATSVNYKRLIQLVNSYLIIEEIMELTISMVVWKNHSALQWRHNDCDGVSNHQPHAFLLNRLFRRRSKKTSKLRVTGLCEGNSPVTSHAEMFPFDDVIMVSTALTAMLQEALTIMLQALRTPQNISS